MPRSDVNETKPLRTDRTGLAGNETLQGRTPGYPLLRKMNWARAWMGLFFFPAEQDGQISADDAYEAAGRVNSSCLFLSYSCPVLVLLLSCSCLVPFLFLSCSFPILVLFLSLIISHAAPIGLARFRDPPIRAHSPSNLQETGTITRAGKAGLHRPGGSCGRPPQGSLVAIAATLRRAGSRVCGARRTSRSPESEGNLRPGGRLAQLQCVRDGPRPPCHRRPKLAREQRLGRPRVGRVTHRRSRACIAPGR
jgi:hypothetical protein